MMAVDTRTGRLLTPDMIEDDLKGRWPCRKWLQQHAVRLESRRDEEASYCRRVGARTTQDPAEAVPGDAGGARPGAACAGRGRAGGDRLHGRRYPHAGPVTPGPLAVRLFPAAVCTGHQSADRSPARADRHVTGDLFRCRTQPVCRRPAACRAPDGQQPGPVGKQVRPAAGTVGSTLPACPHRPELRPHAGPAQRHRCTGRAGRRTGAKRQVHSWSCRTGTLRRTACPCTRCWPPARYTNG